MRLIAVAAMLATSTSAAAQPRADVEYFPLSDSGPAPFSAAVRAGETLYLSGAIGLGADDKLPAGIEAQTKQTMDYIGATLKRAGLGWGDVVKCTVMLDDMADWPAFNRVYVPYFPVGKLPARSAFGADGLALGALVEVECLAHAKAAGQ